MRVITRTQVGKQLMALDVAKGRTGSSSRPLPPALQTSNLRKKALDERRAAELAEAAARAAAEAAAARAGSSSGGSAPPPAKTPADLALERAMMLVGSRQSGGTNTSTGTPAPPSTPERYWTMRSGDTLLTGYTSQNGTMTITNRTPIDGDRSVKI